MVELQWEGVNVGSGGDNDDFLGARLEQDPLLVAKFHAIRTIRPGFWWALAATYGYGGRTRSTASRGTRFSGTGGWRL